MSKRYQGNIITDSPVEPSTSSASGVWSIGEAREYYSAGLWPLSPLSGDVAYIQKTQQTTNGMQFVYISTTGNGTNFGDLTYSSYASAGCGSSTRGIVRHANTVGAGTKHIEYFTLAIVGGSGADFGDATVSVRDMGALSNSTRAVFGGGAESPTNVMDYITIASTGNATDFGDLYNGNVDGAMGTASSTRGLFSGGRIVNTYQNVIGYITIASTGNTTDFGDLTVARFQPGSLCNGTRAVFGGGATTGLSELNTIDYVTIASTGNATDFGDVTVARFGAGGTCNATRGLFCGGWNSNVIDYITIGSTGNATDFGDLTSSVFTAATTSSAHGGLS